MALSNTLFAGLSGLNVNQTKLNVVANNIANVNTVAFKSSRVEFKPQFYVTDAGGTQPQDPFGGTNPSQRGLGAEVAAIEKNFQPGSIEATGRPTDLAIDGDGFFIVKGDEQRYTRDGTFKINSLNQLVTNGGDIVQGFGVDKDFKVISGNLTRHAPRSGVASGRAAPVKVAASSGSPFSVSWMRSLTVLPGGKMRK